MTDLKEKAAGLLNIKGDLNIEPVSGGGNNKIYLVDTDKGRYILKEYFWHKDDKRDRLESEFLFAAFAWGNGIRNIAEPVAHDPATSIGIYRFIPGTKLKAEDIGEEEVEQALIFFRKLNENKGTEESKKLPVASEACFSIEEHVRVIDKRVERLKGIDVSDVTDKDALDFVNNELMVRWMDVKREVLSKAEEQMMGVEERISQDDAVISPSDFGFHNAIRGDDGIIRFIDFEYAGWDDPAKTAGDFFSQVAVPVPMKYCDKFIETVCGCVYNVEKTEKRIRLLLPMYRIKWCCIIMNHFMRVDRERKVFAVQDAMNKKYGQLEKARKQLLSLESLL